MYGTYQRLNLHVGENNRAVIKAASRKLKRSIRFARKHRAARHAFYRQMLNYHHDARDLFVTFRF
jgi:hypothetical protein